MAEKSKARPITDSVTEISVWNYPFTKYCVNSNYSTYTTYTITQHAICTEFQPSFHQTAGPDCQMSPWTRNTKRPTSTRSKFLRLFGRLVLKYATNGALWGGRIVKEEREISSVFSQSRLYNTTFLFSCFIPFLLSSLQLTEIMKTVHAVLPSL